MIKKNDMENIIGMMGEYLKECGKMGYKMEKGKYMNLKKINLKKEYGKKEKGFNGLINSKCKYFIVYILVFF